MFEFSNKYHWLILWVYECTHTIYDCYGRESSNNIKWRCIWYDIRNYGHTHNSSRIRTLLPEYNHSIHSKKISQNVIAILSWFQTIQDHNTLHLIILMFCKHPSKRTSCESCLMPFDSDPGKRESERYCSYCFQDGKLCYEWDLTWFKQVCYEWMLKRWIKKPIAKFYTFCVGFAPRWKNPS